MSMDTLRLEQTILSDVMCGSCSYEACKSVISDKDFAYERNSEIWLAIQQLSEHKNGYDLLSVRDYLESKQRLKFIGGEEYISKLTQVALDYSQYSEQRTVQNATRLRQLTVIRLLRESAQEIFELADKYDGRPITDVLASAEGILNNVIAAQKSDDIVIKDGSELMQESLKDFLRQSENPGICGISTGLQILDEKTDGLHRGEMIIIAAPPSMGKTAFAVNLIQNALHSTKYPVVIFSLEMTTKDIGRRMWATESKVNYRQIRTGKADTHESNKMTLALGRLSNPLLKITSHSPLTPSKIRMILRKMSRKYGGIQMAMVDYVQMMDADNPTDNRNNDLTKISRELKRMAMDFDFPFIVLSQLTKVVETQKRKPTNGDLRECGALAQDADMIIFVHRQEKYEADNQEFHGKAELIISKSRNGETGSVVVGWDGSTFRFFELPNGNVYNGY